MLLLSLPWMELFCNRPEFLLLPAFPWKLAGWVTGGLLLQAFIQVSPASLLWLIDSPPPPQRVKGVDWSLNSTCCRCSVELLAPQSRDGWAGSWTRRRHGTSYKAALAVDFGKQHKHACMRARCLQQWRCAWGPAVWHYSQWQERSCFCLELHRQQRHNSGRVTLGDGPVNRQLILS